jgi:UDP-glucose 4-epimerase
MTESTEKRALVTGGAGFIASHVVDQLVERGVRVTVLDDLSAGRLANLDQVSDAVEFVEGSVCDADLVTRLVEGQDWVFNFAANANVPRSVERPDIDFATNALGAHFVLEACRRCGTQRVLQASTAAVYGEPQYTPMDESHPLRPISPYGASKLSAESLGFAYHHTYGVPFTSVRIFNTYGPRQPRYVIYDLFRKLERDRGKLEVLGTGEQVRDYCYVSDTAGAFVTLAENEGAVGQAYNIAGGHPVSIRELVQMILHTLDLRRTEVNYTGRSWPGDITRLVAETRKLRDLGFRPTVSLDEGLRRFAAWIDI